MKKCAKCKEIKETDAFYKNKSTKSGFQSYCKDCDYNLFTELTCDICGDAFNIRHRNIRSRKTLHCLVCVNKLRSERCKLLNGAKNPYWKGGKTISSKGYVYERDTGEKHGYKLAHRKVIEKHLGRLLSKKEKVHHLDNDKANNSLSNLAVLTPQEHGYAHKSMEYIGFELFKRGLVQFDEKDKVYRATELLDEFLNS